MMILMNQQDSVRAYASSFKMPAVLWAGAAASACHVVHVYKSAAAAVAGYVANRNVARSRAVTWE